MKLERYFYWALVAILAFLLLYNCNRSKPCPAPSIVVKRDTIQGDPVIVKERVPVYIKKPIFLTSDDKMAPAKDPINPNDYVAVIREFDTSEVINDYFSQRGYDTTYRFLNGEFRVEEVVSENKLTKQKVTPRWYVTTTEKTFVQEVAKKREWSVGIQTGYGGNIMDGRVRRSFYVGIGLQRNIFSFSLKKKNK